MTVEDVSLLTLSPTTTRWLGYGLAVIATPLPFVTFLESVGSAGDLIAAFAVTAPIALMVVVACAPAAFEVKARRSLARAVNFVLLIPAAGLLAAAFTSPLVYPQICFLTSAAGAAVGLLTGLWAPRRDAPVNAPILLLFLALFGAGWGAGAPALANHRFDHSAGQIFQAAVEARNVTYGRGGPGYRLRLGPWGPVTHARYVGVPLVVYEALSPGDTACVTLHPGALAMPWYRIARC
jgi:hypothetical protein